MTRAAGIATALFALVAAGSMTAETERAASFDAFRKAAAVLRHPRCLNCHVPGDAPLVGATSEVHPMQVKRGPDGQGTAVMRCSTCHQDVNTAAPHAPPGSREWKLPAPATRMAWVGLTDVQLCRAVIDARLNGGMRREQIVHHMESDPRVVWAWNPGPGREAPPIAHGEFVALIRTWIEKGASCGE
jgi:hypothetical protein